jgi:hypothetical protein
MKRRMQDSALLMCLALGGPLLGCKVPTQSQPPASAPAKAADDDIVIHEPPPPPGGHHELSVLISGDQPQQTAWQLLRNPYTWSVGQVRRANRLPLSPYDVTVVYSAGSGMSPDAYQRWVKAVPGVVEIVTHDPEPAGDVK